MMMRSEHCAFRTQDLFNEYFSSRNEHCLSTDLHFFDVTWLPLYFEVNPAWPVDKITLLNDEFISAVIRFQRQAAVMHKVSAQCSARAARRRIFGNIVCRSEKARMCTRLANFECFARERVTTGAAVTSVNISQQCCVDMNSRKSARERIGTAKHDNPVVITWIGRVSSRSSRAIPTHARLQPVPARRRSRE